MATFALVLAILNALVVIVLMALQTEKAQQGGVMGLGATGGRQSGNIDMLVGAERILKPATKWSSVGFLFSSLLASIPADKVTIVHFIVFLAIYLVIMLYGDRVWRAALGLNS